MNVGGRGQAHGTRRQLGSSVAQIEAKRQVYAQRLFQGLFVDLICYLHNYASALVNSPVLFIGLTTVCFPLYHRFSDCIYEGSSSDFSGLTQK